MALKEANEKRWASARLTRGLEFVPVAKRLVAAKARYQAVEVRTGVPWVFIAVTHQRESSQNWTRSLAQGDPIDRVSTHVPAGRGPFPTWEDAAYDALVNCGPYAARNKDWSVGGTLAKLEEYNGLGYYKRGIDGAPPVPQLPPPPADARCILAAAIAEHAGCLAAACRRRRPRSGHAQRGAGLPACAGAGCRWPRQPGDTGRDRQSAGFRKAGAHLADPAGHHHHRQDREHCRLILEPRRRPLQAESLIDEQGADRSGDYLGDRARRFTMFSFLAMKPELAGIKESVVLFLVGLWSTMAVGVVNYWVGSSAGSSKKDDTIQNMAVK
jgi:lysozyme family protein